MKTPVYAQIEFVKLNENRPSDWPLGSAQPMLFIGSLDTGILKYTLVFGFSGDEQNSLDDFFDYPEFRISGISYERPSDFSAKGTFQKEGPNGGTVSETFNRWETVDIPHGFSIPSDITIINAGSDNNTGTIGGIGDFFCADI